MSTLEAREAWYRSHDCYPTCTETALRIDRVKWLVEECRRQPFRRVLDVGCHDGFSTRWLLSDPGIYLFGIDLCKKAVAAARAQAKGSSADYRELSYTEIPHKPGRFDVVIVFEIIEHLEDSDARELLRIVQAQLSPGGRAYLTTPHIDGPYGQGNDDPSHINLFDQARLESMIREETGEEPVLRVNEQAIWAAWRKDAGQRP